MRKMRRILLVLIASGLIISLTMIIPAGAASSQNGNVKVLDSELVYAETDSVGSINNVQVVDWVSLQGDGTVNVRENKDFSGSSKFQGVYGFSTPKVEGDQIVWGDLTSKGNSQAIASTQFSKDMVAQAKNKIPLDLHYTYTLDGKKVSPDEITGKSGHFKMELTMTNNSKEMSTLDVKDPNTGQMKPTQVETYLPMVIQPYDWYFDNKVFHNLTCDDTGIVFYFPNTYQVGWSIPLFPPATEASDTISVEADVTDFRMPVLTLPVAFLFPKTNQIDPLPTFKAGFEQLYGGIKQVDQGIGDTTTTNTLLNGITQVDSGLQQMVNTSSGLPFAQANIDGQMIPGVDQMSAGVNQMMAGVGSATAPNTLLNGITRVTEGLKQMAASLGPVTNTQSLLYALAAIQSGLLTIQAGANVMIAGIGDAATSLTLLNGVAQITAGLQTMSTGLGTIANPATLIGALNSMATNINAAIRPAVMGVSAGMKLGGGLYTLINTTIAFPDAPSQALWTSTYQPGINATLGAYTGTYLDPAAAGLLTIYGGLATVVIPHLQAIKAGMDTMLAELPTMATGLSDMKAGLQQTVAGIGSASTPNTLLYAANAASLGVQQMQTGIGSAASPDTLLNGTAQIEGGLYQIGGGLTQVKGGLSTGSQSNPGMKEGLQQLSAGLAQAIAGVGSASSANTLLYGSSQISGGLTQMKGGTSQMTQGLMDSLVQLNSTDAQLAAIEKRGKDFDHFLGRAENADNQVRFLFQSKPTYDYKTSGSVVTAIILSVILLIVLAGAGLLLARRAHSA